MAWQRFGATEPEPDGRESTLLSFMKPARLSVTPFASRALNYATCSASMRAVHTLLGYGLANAQPQRRTDGARSVRRTARQRLLIVAALGAATQQRDLPCYASPTRLRHGNGLGAAEPDRRACARFEAARLLIWGSTTAPTSLVL